MRLLMCVLLLLGATSFSNSEIRPNPGAGSIPQLFLAADIVIKGEVLHVSAAGTSSGDFNGRSLAMDVFKARVRVDRAYKGSVNTTTVITFMRPQGSVCTVSICETIRSGEYALFFLVPSGESFKLIEKTLGKFNVSRMNSPSPEEGMKGLELDLFSGLHDSDPRRRLDSVQLIGMLGNVTSTAPLVNQYDVSEMTQRAAIQLSLLRLRDYRLLPRATDVIESSGLDPRLRLFRYQILSEISAIRDKGSVTSLSQLAKSSDSGLRESAIHALREIASPSSTSTLIAALDDQSELIRYDAVLGLAAIESKWELAPSLTTFRANESKYITSWKKWWSERTP